MFSSVSLRNTRKLSVFTNILIRIHFLVPAAFRARWFDAAQLLDYSHSDFNQHIRKRLVSTTNIITNSKTLVLKYFNY